LINVDVFPAAAPDWMGREAAMTTIEVPKGLKGVAVADTTIGDVRGAEGFYHYRQYSAVELAARRSFEDVWHLMFEGDLPDLPASERFRARIGELRALPDGFDDILGRLAATKAPPLASLRTALSHLAAVERSTPSHGASPDVVASEAMRLAAVTPTLVAGLHRLGRELPLVEPDPSLGHAADYLRMIAGAEPDLRHVRAIEQYLVLAVDHGFNASTFTGRVVTSTGADLGGVMVAALSALSGPLHGGAPSLALEMMEQIGSPDRADAWVREALARGERIMGFGHAAYRTHDPRSVALREVVEGLGGPLADLAVPMERAIEATLAELKPERPLQANIELYAGVVMAQCGLPRALFTPTFAVARAIGWGAHALEQAADRTLIRPSANYVGPPPPQPVPALA
jgi:citrate synthase